jgi:guanylate cyclase
VAVRAVDGRRIEVPSVGNLLSRGDLGEERLRDLWESLLSFGEFEGESFDRRSRRRILVGALWIAFPALFVAAASRLQYPWVAGMFLVQIGAHLAALVVLRLAPSRFMWAMSLMFAGDLLTGLTQTILFGGPLESGVQIAWSLMAVLGALVVFTVRTAGFWFLAFIAAVLGATVVPNWVEPVYILENPRSHAAVNLIGTTVLVFSVMAYFIRQRDRYQQQSDDLLHNILPDEIVRRLRTAGGRIADEFDAVSVLFADVVEFTPMSASMSSAGLVGFLDDVFTDIDRLVEDLGLEKIKTVGDEYMVAAGVPNPRPDHAHATAELALRISERVTTRQFAGRSVRFRIGIHSGPAVAGIIGKRKFAYDLWGDVVNTASRMETHGEPGAIQITRSTRDLIQDRYDCQPRGTIDVKGKGEMETWWLVGRLGTVSPTPA